MVVCKLHEYSYYSRISWCVGIPRYYFAWRSKELDLNTCDVSVYRDQITRWINYWSRAVTYKVLQNIFLMSILNVQAMKKVRVRKYCICIRILQMFWYLKKICYCRLHDFYTVFLCRKKYLIKKCMYHMIFYREVAQYVRRYKSFKNW